MVDAWITDRVIILHRGLDKTPWAGTSPETVHYLGLMTCHFARDELEALAERLNLRSDQRTLLRQAYEIRRNHAEIARAEKNSDLYHLLSNSSDDARLIAWLGLDDEVVRAKIIHFQTTLHDVQPIIDGHFLKEELQLPTGPLYRQLLDALRDARLDGRVTTLADERAMVETLIKTL